MGARFWLSLLISGICGYRERAFPAELIAPWVALKTMAGGVAIFMVETPAAGL
jgi:hypothetical protein